MRRWKAYEVTDFHRIVIAGFGNVGQALARLIESDHPSTEGLVVSGVSDPRFGTVVSEALDCGTLLAAVEEGGFADLEGHIRDAGVLEMIDEAGARTLVELTFTDLETGEPATTHIRRAFGAGMNVSTTNKGPIALRYQELRELALAKGVTLAFEGTVMSGTPAVELAQIVRGADCRGVVGILNGTTNHIITRMETGISYNDALTEAQQLGYAEADPSGDVDGHDTAGKLTILAQVLFDTAVAVGDIERISLSDLSMEEVSRASADGERWRYVGRLDVGEGGSVRARVSPKRIPTSDPLAGITGATNAVTFQTDLLGDVTISGPGAGRDETAFSVISDLRRIERASGR